MAQASDSRKLLGDILVEEGALTQEQADAAFAEQAETGGFLGQVLIEMGYIDQASLTAFLAKYCRIPYLSLLNCLVDETLLVLVPKEICLKHRLLPIDKLGKNLTIAIVNPLNKEAVEEVRALCPDLRVKPVVCDWGHFKTVAEQLFKEKLDDTAGGQAAQAACPQAEASAPPMGAADGAVGQGGMSGEAADLAAQEMVAVAENSMYDTYEVLSRKVALFKGLSPESVAAIFASGMTKEFAEGHTIFEKGDTSSELYVILGGSVTIRDGARVIDMLSSGEMFGEMALVSDQPRSAAAVAEETTSAFVLTEDIFQRLMTKRVAIQLLLNMLGIMAQRLLAANEQLAGVEQT